MIPEFIAWPKTPRYENDTIIVTEKIDGTNAQILITPDEQIFVGSRTRWITPDNDNYGFAKWVDDHYEDILQLGHGRHYGEWYGCGIQRTYGLPDKRFALFNTSIPKESLPPCVGQVPVLYAGENKQSEIIFAIDTLRREGSRVSPGFMRVEGVCIYYTQTKRVVKCILDK